MSNDQPVDEFDLAALDDAFRDAPDEGAPVPDGRYPVTVDRVELKRSQASGAKMLEWELRIVGTEHAGRKIWKYTLIETPEHMVWAKRDLRACGLELAKISDLPGRLHELLDLTIEVAVKTKNEFQGIYFRPGTVESNGGAEGKAGARPF